MIQRMHLESYAHVDLTRREVALPISTYQGVRIATAYRANLIVERTVLLELKAVERLLPIHEAQTLTCLRHSRLKLGLLMNFNVTRLKFGVRRFVV